MKQIDHPDNIDEKTSRFFQALLKETGGSPEAQVSMYDIGQQVGLDRNEAARIAENIMAEGWAEVRTLSGGIAVTQKGIDSANAVEDRRGTGQGGITGIGPGALLESSALRSIEIVVAKLRLQIEKGGLAYGPVAELVADLRTIDAQLASPRPKTAILRACIKSILGLLQSEGHSENTDLLKGLLA